MKRIRRIVCMILVICFVSIAPIQVGAVTAVASEQSLALVVTRLSNQYPDSIVNVVDGVIHMYIPETDSVENTTYSNREISTMATTTSIYAPDGGIWGNFKRPWYTWLQTSPTIPSQVVFTSKAQADLLMKEATSPGIIGAIADARDDGYTTEEIIDIIYNNFDVILTEILVEVPFMGNFFNFYHTVDLISFRNAYYNSQSGKVRIDYATIDGYPINYYYTWESDYVTDSPWEDYQPIFYEGIYSFATN